MIRSKSVVAVPPGATIKEQLRDRGMSQKEFAERMDMTPKHISQLINGEAKISPEVAVRLEMVLGVPAKFWNNLEAIYQEKLIKARLENTMEEDIQLCKNYPYNEMSKLGWVSETRKMNERVINLRKFFEVVNLGIVSNRKLIGVAYRLLADPNENEYSLLAWSQKAKVEARKHLVSCINIQKLKNNLQTIRSMTTESPDMFCGKLEELLNSCGIAIVFLPHLKGTYLHGATFIDGKKIVLGITLRGKYADMFWFSLFHEIGHIILGHIGQNEISKEDELDADRFASEILIPQNKYDSFINNNRINRQSIIDFSYKVGIDCGIVVGRLQRDKYIGYDMFNDLRTKYDLQS